MLCANTVTNLGTNAVAVKFADTRSDNIAFASTYGFADTGAYVATVAKPFEFPDAQTDISPYIFTDSKPNIIAEQSTIS